MEKILIVDDERSMRDVLSIMLRRAGYGVMVASDGEEAIAHIDKELFDLVITDLKMPKAGGLDVLRAVKESAPESVVLIITAFASTESAVEAMKLGAYDYLTKPFQVDEVQLIVRNALEKRRLTTENMLLKREVARPSPTQIIGESEAMRKVFEMVRKVADTKSNVLISGESGTGKELIARAIHNNSGRSRLPFVTVNCSALPEPLLESELFGHMKGAFTGAVSNKAGLFEVANGGSIFLDEIGETTPAMQVKLLRVIQEREFRRVGGTRDMKVDVRVIAATNKDLEKAIADGSFREDLYYRLHVAVIRLPPLRERGRDALLLARHFLSRYAREYGRGDLQFAPEALTALSAHGWPGNVRELQNAVAQAAALAEANGVVSPALLPESLRRQKRSTGPTEDYRTRVDAHRRGLITEALERAGGNRSRAARDLGLSRQALLYLIRELNVAPRPRPGH